MNKCSATMGFQGGKAHCLLYEGHKEDHKFFEEVRQYSPEEIKEEQLELSKMSQRKYVAAFVDACHEMIELTKRKNSDYAESENAFANFETIEQITGNRVSAEIGILVRITDKIKRIGSLFARTGRVLDETLEDTVFDLAVYSVILLVRLRFKSRAEKAVGSVTQESNS